MGRYAVNFAVTVWVNDENINAGKAGQTDIESLLSDEEYNSLVSDALDAMEVNGGNVVTIDRLEDNES